jgi:hypothetical protein
MSYGTGDVKRSRKTNHLFCGHAYGLDGELASAHIEEVLEVRTQQVDDEHIMESFLTEVVNMRDTSYEHNVLDHAAKK